MPYSIISMEKQLFTVGATTLSITPFRITTLSIKDFYVTLSVKGLYVTLRINDTQHNNALPLC
jgi:hypothetical protein